jgi:hypothetical protein
MSMGMEPRITRHERRGGVVSYCDISFLVEYKANEVVFVMIAIVIVTYKCDLNATINASETNATSAGESD